MPGDLLSGTLIEIARDLREKRAPIRSIGRASSSWLAARI
jgi:hypothetical protein